MLDASLEIDANQIIEKTFDRFLSFFGKDQITQRASRRLASRVRIAVHDSAEIQCVGMSRPIPIDDLYQPTRLRREEVPGVPHREYSPISLLELHEDAIVWGLPGAGKSVLLKKLFRTLLVNEEYIPVLYILRQSDSVEDLQSFCQDISHLKFTSKKRVALLVDGYDEISTKERRKVSQALSLFSAQECGFFVLSCREYYQLVDLRGRFFFIEPFNRTDATRYVDALLKAYQKPLSATDVIEELVQCGFADFLGSPLLLTLVCVLKAGPLPQLPKNVIGVIRRAIDTLTFKWDESRGIGREGDHSIDGEDRIRALMRIAFAFDQPIGTEAQAFAEAKRYLQLIRREEVGPQRLLLETAQWYGLFVPVDNSKWTFTHRTVHDYLAARQWVETGKFLGPQTSTIALNTRTAYAACLMEDATPLLVKIITKSQDPSIFVEAISNSAPFYTEPVARALIRRLEIDGFQGLVTFAPGKASTQVATDGNFLYMASDQLVRELFIAASETPTTRGKQMLYLLSLHEVVRRGLSNVNRRRVFPKETQLYAKLGRSAPLISLSPWLDGVSGA